MNPQSEDIRWIQRYRHFSQAFSQLEGAVKLSKERPLSELEEQGVIQAFEYTHELAWNVLKDFLEDRGAPKLFGSKDSTREAFKRGLLEDGTVWMEMIRSRNLTSHTYNRGIATQIVRAVIEKYAQEFQKLLETMKPWAEEDEK